MSDGENFTLDISKKKKADGSSVLIVRFERDRIKLPVFADTVDLSSHLGRQIFADGLADLIEFHTAEEELNQAFRKALAMLVHTTLIEIAENLDANESLVKNWTELYEFLAGRADVKLKKLRIRADAEKGSTGSL